MNRLIVQAASQYQAQGPRDASSATSSRSRWPPPSCARRCTRTRSSTSCSRKAEITDRKATRAELEADLESEEGHVHGPGCGHDHAARQAEGEEGRGRRRKAKAAAKAERRPVKPKPPPRARSRRRRPSPSRPSRVKDAAGRQGAAAKAGQGRSRSRRAKKAAGEEAGQEGLSERRDRLRGSEPRARRSARATGFRLDVIYPADDPHTAVLSRGGERVRLTTARTRRRCPTGCRRSSPNSC